MGGGVRSAICPYSSHGLALLAFPARSQGPMRQCTTDDAWCQDETAGPAGIDWRGEGVTCAAGPAFHFWGTHTLHPCAPAVNTPPRKLYHLGNEVALSKASRSSV